MTTQSFKNHIRYHDLYHFITLPLWFAGFIGSIVNLITAAPANFYSASLLVLVFVLIFLILAMLRIYPLKAQDRAIRGEESLRYYILTGKSFHPRLTIHQIVALRFASDEELPSLAKKAVDEKLSPKEIKSQIKNWREDHYRI